MLLLRYRVSCQMRFQLVKRLDHQPLFWPVQGSWTKIRPKLGMVFSQMCIPGDYARTWWECTGKRNYIWVAVKLCGRKQRIIRSRIHWKRKAQSVYRPHAWLSLTRTLFMPRAKRRQTDVIPDGCVNFAFLVCWDPRDTIFTQQNILSSACNGKLWYDLWV